MTVTATVRIKPGKGDSYRLTLKSHYAHELRFRCEGYSRLATVGGEARRSLETLGFGVLKLGRFPQRGAEFLGEIREIGYAALVGLLGRGEGSHASKGTHEVKNFFAQVLARAPMAGGYPELDFVSPVDYPLDLLPALDSGVASRFNASAGLETQASNCFLGLRFAVRKFITSSRTTEISDLENPAIVARDPAADLTVSLAPYWHEKITDVSNWIKSLRDLDPFVVAESFPNSEMMSRREPGPELARLLVEGRDPREDIVHITAHCRASADVPTMDHSITFASRTSPFKTREVQLRVRTIQTACAQSLSSGARNRLAFITACGATNIRYDSPMSIPDVFLGCGYGAVVSPLVSVDMGPATALSLHFYRSLISGKTVGGALVEARKHMMRDFSNPLGLAYTCYGESRLTLIRITVNASR